jgi:hypothetical protein
VKDIHRRLLNRIIFASAWADGQLAPAEVDYLRQLMIRQRLESDQDLAQLLLTPVPLPQLESWIAEYLADSSTIERLAALAAIANLLMADGKVTASEHHFLDDIHSLMAEIPPQREPTVIEEASRSIAQGFQRTVRRVLQAIHPS